MDKTERKVVKDVASYLRLHQTEIIYRFDIAADLRVQPHIAANLKRTFQHDKGYPDLFIAEPCGGYAGLYIELKGTREDLYTLSGKFRSTKHIVEQVQYLNKLADKGYKTMFCCGLEETIKAIEDYLSS